MARSIQDLALGTADVAAITPKVISATIEEVARGKRVFAQLFKENSDLMRTAGLEISFPKKGTGIAASFDVAPNTSIAPSSFAYDATTIRVKKAGIRLEFTTEALESALRDVIKDHIYEAGIVYAETIDDRAISVALNLTAVSSTVPAASTVIAGSYPIWSVTTVSGCTIDGLDYATGTIYVTAAGSVTPGTITYQYAERVYTSTLYVDAVADNTLSAWDMLAARAKIKGKNFNPNVVVINDDDVPGLLYDSNLKFLDASAYGSREAILNGEIGKVFGLKVVTSTRTATGHAVYVDTGKLGYYVRKRDLRGYREDKPEFDAIWYHMWSEGDFGVVNNNAIALSVNHGPTSGSLRVRTS
jgi:N4-gp56 family major capsid protein